MRAQVASLLDKNSKEDFVTEVRELYQELRDEHYTNLRERNYLALNAARLRKPAINWKNKPAPIKPTFIGTKTITDYPLRVNGNPFSST